MNTINFRIEKINEENHLIFLYKNEFEIPDELDITKCKDNVKNFCTVYEQQIMAHNESLIKEKLAMEYKYDLDYILHALNNDDKVIDEKNRNRILSLIRYNNFISKIIDGDVLFILSQLLQIFDHGGF